MESTSKRVIFKRTTIYTKICLLFISFFIYLFIVCQFKFIFFVKPCLLYTI